jgi:hypothetical protein
MLFVLFYLTLSPFSSVILTKQSYEADSSGDSCQLPLLEVAHVMGMV